MIRTAFPSCIAAALVATASTLAWAQAGGGAPPAGGGGAPPSGGGGDQPAQPPSPYTPPGGGVQVGPGAGAQAPKGPVGGGNATESSARSITGDQEDTFDLGGSRGSGALRGGEGGPVFLGGPKIAGEEVPGSHVVRRGDTLWGICDSYFHNPYQWPRVWSYNPQIKNPHWIYPGDEVKLREGAQAVGTVPTVPGVPGGGMTLVDRRRQVPNGTLFLRDQGWIEDESDQVWGQVTGSAEDKMFLSDFDEVYLHVDPKHDVHIGEELTVFRPIKSSAAGHVVQIQGTVRIDQWNPQDRVARAQIMETLEVIERGARIGPLDRKFEIVPPRRNDTDVQAHILAAVHPFQFYGQNQVVFIDQGGDQGLKPGNRLFVLRRGDAWRRSLVTPGAAYRISPDAESNAPPMEKTPGSHRQEETYPDEFIGELRVVQVRKDNAVCIVTSSKTELEAYDLAVARKGY